MDNEQEPKNPKNHGTNTKVFGLLTGAFVLSFIARLGWEFAGFLLGI
jgi:hypothetical protein